MKYILAILLVIAGALLVLNSGMLFSASYSSVSVGISFRHSSSYIPRSAGDDSKITIDRPSSLASQARFSLVIDRFRYGETSSLEQALAKVSVGTYDKKKAVHNGIDGLDFSFKGALGEERGFIFASMDGDYFYVLTTRSLSTADAQERKELETVLGSLKLLR